MAFAELERAPRRLLRAWLGGLCVGGALPALAPSVLRVRRCRAVVREPSTAIACGAGPDFCRLIRGDVRPSASA